MSSNTSSKKELFHNLNEAMKQALREIKEKESIMVVEEQGSSNDVSYGSAARKCLTIMDQVSDFVAKENFEAAVTLLRHVYRITPSKVSKTPIASARKLCKDAVSLEAKWVRRRATLRKKNASTAVIRKEKENYTYHKLKEIHDLLATAILELSEGIDKRGGEFYSSLAHQYEVVLPPLVSGDFVTTVAPVLFHSSIPVDVPRFEQSVKINHGFKPVLKKLERNLYIIKNAPLIGLKEKPKDVVLQFTKMRDKFGKTATPIDFCLVHKSSPLFWYAYDLPIKYHTLQFADELGVDNYGSYNSAFNQIEGGKISRDDFVKLREQSRLSNLRFVKLKLQSERETFFHNNYDLVKEISGVTDSIQELSEVSSKLKHKFLELTAIELGEEDKLPKGLPISKYKNLKSHMDKLYSLLQVGEDDADDNLWDRLKEDRINARIAFYEYMESVTMRKRLTNRKTTLTELLSDRMHMARGSGKALKSVVLG